MNREAAHDFLYTHGRLLERRQLELRFSGGSADSVVAALDAYRNPDGGYGQALEPDCRTPHSQPEATRWALQVLADVGRLDASRARSTADWLDSVALEDGALPFCLPTVEGYPCAPWWQAADPPLPDLNPTGRLVALLRAPAAAHPWVQRAGAWCWQRVETESADQYQVHAAVEFLLAEPDRERAEAALGRLRAALSAGRVVPLDPKAPPPRADTHTPLQFAPTPDHPLRKAFPDAVLEGFLARLAAGQQEDGGWPIDWPAPGSTAVSEWRAIRTLEALEVLAAWGRL